PVGAAGLGRLLSGEFAMDVTLFVEALLNGLSESSILILAAVGLAITFGVMRVINMAHGEMLMLGAFAGYVFTDPRGFPRLIRGLGNLVGLDIHTDIHFEYNLYLAIPFAFVTVGLFGYLLEVCLIRFLYGRPLDTLLATYGVSLMLQQLVLRLFGGDPKLMSPPAELHEVVYIFGTPFPAFRLFVMGFAGLCLAAVYF